MTVLNFAQCVLAAWRDAIVASDALAAKRLPTRPENLVFLPAALELMERPPSPLARFGVTAIGVLLLIALVFGVFGQVDIVVTARGRVVPQGAVKAIQAAETGVIRQVHVREGQRVSAGQILVQLDAQAADADRDRLRADLEAASHSLAVSALLLDYLGQAKIADERGVISQIARAEAEAEWRHFDAQINELSSAVERARADIQTNEAEIARVDAVLPLAADRLRAQQILAERGFGRRLTLLAEQQEVVSLEKDRGIRREQGQSLRAQLRGVEAQARALRQAKVAEVLERYIEARRTATAAERELFKGDLRQSLSALRAPVAGFVHNLTAVSKGQVVQPAETLVVIVPEAAPLTIEALVENKDIGFVAVGQAAAIKVDAFPAQKFGAIRGQISRIGEDAVEDEQLGLAFPLSVDLQPDSAKARRPLTPGMAVTIDIQTGKRRLIEAVLEPLFRWRTEALRER